VECFKCGRTGHVARDWETDKGMPRSHEQGHPQRSVSVHTVMHAPCTNTHVHIVMHNTDRVAHTHGMDKNRKILMLLDLEASCSVISRPHAAHAHITPCTHNQISQC